MLSFLDKEYKDVIKQKFGSTAAAAKRVPKILKKKYAAIANSYAAKLYGLKIIHQEYSRY
jgi:prephenate dehydratase